MNKDEIKAVKKLLVIAKHFAPTDHTVQIFKDIGRDDGKGRMLGKTCNIDVTYTDLEAISFKEAIDEVEELL